MSASKNVLTTWREQGKLLLQPCWLINSIRGSQANTSFFLRNDIFIHSYQMTSGKHDSLSIEEEEAEILKTAAQVWHAHLNSCRGTYAHDAHRRNLVPKPSRFKLEATATPKGNYAYELGSTWDFKESLWDCYEIVAVYERLERALVLEDGFLATEIGVHQSHGRKKESKNSLRNLFNRMSSRRFSDEADDSLG